MIITLEILNFRRLDYLPKPLSQENVTWAVGKMIAKKSQNAVTDSTTAGGSQLLCMGSFTIDSAMENHDIKWRTAKGKNFLHIYYSSRVLACPRQKLLIYYPPDDDGGNVDNKLHATVSMLKKTLTDVGLNISIKFASGAYRLELGAGVTCDSDQFKAFANKELVVNDETIYEIEQIVARYRGDFFQDKNYRWCIAERIRLQQCYLEIIKKTALYFLGTKKYKKAEEILRSGIGRLPLQEDLHELLLKTLYLQDRHVALNSHYEYLEKLLREELAIEVRSEATRWYERQFSSNLR